MSHRDGTWRPPVVEVAVGALVAVDPQHKRLFHLTELTERLRVSGSRDEAISALDEAGAGDGRADRPA